MRGIYSPVENCYYLEQVCLSMKATASSHAAAFLTHVSLVAYIYSQRILSWPCSRSFFFCALLFGRGWRQRYPRVASDFALTRTVSPLFVRFGCNLLRAIVCAPGLPIQKSSLHHDPLFSIAVLFELSKSNWRRLFSRLCKTRRQSRIAWECQY